MFNNKKALALCIGMFAIVTANQVMATDYSAYSTQELAQFRGTLQNASQEEKDAFRSAWQSKTAEEKQMYASQNQKNVNKGTGICDGTGKGSGKGRTNR